MEQIKLFEEMLYPDPRSALWEMVSVQTGERRKITMEDHHRRFSRVKLNSNVPEHVRNGIAIAANLYIYSWFVYAFGPMADLQCLATLELALRHRNGTAANGKKPRFRELLSNAVKQGWLVDAELPVGLIMPEASKDENGQPVDPTGSETNINDPQRRTKELANSLPDWRNIIAHGQFMLFPPGNRLLGLVVAIVNQLWPNPESGPQGDR